VRNKVDEVPESRLKALEEIENEKVKIANAYNKRVVEKMFSSGISSMENDFAVGDSKW
jgi:hypothetical protein